MKTFGRRTIYANYTEEQLLQMNDKALKKTLQEIMKVAAPIHDINKAESIYLRDYLYGEQDIFYEKQKQTREEINNKTVENWAFALTDFKKTWLLAKPIQYTQKKEKNGDEISLLNDFCSNVNKNSKDMDIYLDMLYAGRGYRYTAPNGNVDYESPFESINVNPWECECVYSSQLGNEKLFSFIDTSMRYWEVVNNVEEEKYYTEYTLYLRGKKVVISNKSGDMIVTNISILPIKKHYIEEYYLNKRRISLVEIGKPLFNDVNYLESLDKDDMEQYVNAIMVFINASVSKEQIEEIKKLGAFSISSRDNKPADVKLLEQRLDANTTQTYYSRLVNALHQILGVPKAGDSGSVSYGDTGQARLTGQGFTSAGIRISGDEVSFKTFDINSLRTMLEICHAKGILLNLKLSDIEPQLQRDMSENMLVKTQALMNLLSCDVPREIGNALIGLFPDPNAVTKKQEELFGKQQSSRTKSDTTNEVDKANNQNNNITNIEQKQLQNK